MYTDAWSPFGAGVISDTLISQGPPFKVASRVFSGLSLSVETLTVGAPDCTIETSSAPPMSPECGIPQGDTTTSRIDVQVVDGIPANARKRGRIGGTHPQPASPPASVLTA
jgi:hypothetical protein